MHINYQFVLHCAELLAQKRPNAKVLDYGCGKGEVVLAARKKGIDAYGAEVFHGGTKARQDVEASGLLGSTIREMANDRIDFEDETFDLVVNNQVFEHVHDLDVVLGEINRVMKKDALLLSLFPSKEVFREGHIGIPFSHWFPENARYRYYYTLFLRGMGMGSNKKQITKAQWAKISLEWIDKYTIYRSKREILRSFSQYFEMKMMANDYITFRLLAMRPTAWLARLFKVPIVRQIAPTLLHRYTGMVILANKKGWSHPDAPIILS